MDFIKTLLAGTLVIFSGVSLNAMHEEAVMLLPEYAEEALDNLDQGIKEFQASSQNSLGAGTTLEHRVAAANSILDQMQQRSDVPNFSSYISELTQAINFSKKILREPMIARFNHERGQLDITRPNVTQHMGVLNNFLKGHTPNNPQAIEQSLATAHSILGKEQSLVARAHELNIPYKPNYKEFKKLSELTEQVEYRLHNPDSGIGVRRLNFDQPQ